jgi:hypothetical protein
VTLWPIGPSAYNDGDKTHQSIFRSAEDNLIKDAVNLTPFLFEQEKKQGAQNALAKATVRYGKVHLLLRQRLTFQKESGKTWARNNTMTFYRSLNPMPSALLMSTFKRTARTLIQRGYKLRPSVWLRISEHKHQTQTATGLLESSPPVLIFKKDENGRLWAFEHDVILDVVLNTIVELDYYDHIKDPTMKTMFCAASTAVRCAMQERASDSEVKFGVAEFKPVFDEFCDYFDETIVQNPELLARWMEYTSCVSATLKNIQRKK